MYNIHITVETFNFKYNYYKQKKSNKNTYATYL